jgi:hypothetical protein
MKHPNEESLILYYYGDLDTATITEHLQACELCRSRYQTLQNALQAMNAMPVPERGEEYGNQVWEALRDRLPQRPRFIWPGLFFLPRWAKASGVALLILAAFLIGRFSTRFERHVVEPTAGQTRERILLSEVREHLERSQRALVELLNSEATGRVDISDQQALAADLLAANRIYRLTAASLGETAIANVLDDLERVLAEISYSPSELSQSELDRLRQRIDSQGTLFKVRVVRSQVWGREKEIAQKLARITS